MIFNCYFDFNLILIKGIGDWGLGMGPIPNPQSPYTYIVIYLYTYILLYNRLKYNKIINIKPNNNFKLFCLFNSFFARKNILF